MANVFKQLIRKEFGENNYYKYFFSCQNLLYDKEFEVDKVEDDEVYKDIYENLKAMDLTLLAKKQARLSDTMMIALNISKSYLMVMITSILTIIFLFTQNLHPSAVVLATVAVTLAFIYKTYEYITNKFCYIDAHIVIIYKTVLERVLEEAKQ